MLRVECRQVQHGAVHRSPGLQQQFVAPFGQGMVERRGCTARLRRPPVLAPAENWVFRILWCVTHRAQQGAD
jgi:hypothetical protein